MTKDEAWTAFAAQALGACMVGQDRATLRQRAGLAADWADAMTEEWIKRHADVAEPKPARKRA